MEIINDRLLRNVDIKSIEDMSQIVWDINTNLAFNMSEITKPQGGTTIEIKVGIPTSTVDVKYTSSDRDKIQRKKKKYEDEIPLLRSQSKQYQERANDLIIQAQNAPTLDTYCKLSNDAEKESCKAAKLNATADSMEAVVQELQNIIAELDRGNNVSKRYTMLKYGEYNPLTDTVTLYVEASQEYGQNLLLSTLVHELFHAFYHKHQPCSIIREIDEAMVEFSMLSYLNYLVGQDSIYQALLTVAKKSVESKKYGMGELPAYGFGSYLYDYCNKQKDWINAYFDKIGKINVSDSDVEEYKQSLYPSYTDDEKKTYDTLSKILFGRAHVGKGGSGLSTWSREVLEDIKRNPSNDFSLNDIYKLANIYQQKHPDNKHICAKIRQIMQILCDKGLIQRVDKGKYRKLSI